MTEHQTMLSIERLHAGVVVFVTTCATLVYIYRPSGFPQDLLGFVYGGALTYVGGRAGSVRSALVRRSDTPVDGSDARE